MTDSTEKRLLDKYEDRIEKAVRLSDDHRFGIVSRACLYVGLLFVLIMLLLGVPPNIMWWLP